MRLILRPDLNISILYFVCIYYLYQFYNYAKKELKDKNLIKFNLLTKIKKYYKTLKIKYIG